MYLRIKVELSCERLCLFKLLLSQQSSQSGKVENTFMTITHPSCFVLPPPPPSHTPLPPSLPPTSLTSSYPSSSYLTILLLLPPSIFSFPPFLPPQLPPMSPNLFSSSSHYPIPFTFFSTSQSK